MPLTDVVPGTFSSTIKSAEEIISENIVENLEPSTAAIDMCTDTQPDEEEDGEIVDDTIEESVMQAATFSKASKQAGEEEDGEIVDDEEEQAVLNPVSSSCSEEATVPTASFKDISDDESPEEILNSYAKKIEMMKQNIQPAIDPKLCRLCKKEEFKYRCPRCDFRSCSLACSKQHKVDFECDGVRQSFQSIQKLSAYDSQKSIDDQKFMHGIKEKVGTPSQETAVAPVEVDDPYKLRLNPNSGPEKFLIQAARMRRVWLGYTEELSLNKLESSYHEQFSDTVFWTIDMIFRKQTLDGVVEYSKTVNKIPETIRLATILKQFVAPRKYGCVVSESDLDIKKLQPFIDRGIEEINVFMKIHSVEDKFYGILPNNTILENLRNRVVADHPKFIIALNDEFVDMELISSEENETLCKKYGGFTKNAPRRPYGNGPPRQFHRGGGGGGGYQNRNQGQNRGFNKRKFDGEDRGASGAPLMFKRRGTGRRNSGAGRTDDFDPFEPFGGQQGMKID